MTDKPKAPSAAEAEEAGVRETATVALMAEALGVATRHIATQTVILDAARERGLVIDESVADDVKPEVFESLLLAVKAQTIRDAADNIKSRLGKSRLSGTAKKTIREVLKEAQRDADFFAAPAESAGAKKH